MISNCPYKIQVALRVALLIVSIVILSHCRTDSFVRVESANQNSRVDYLVIHGTSENFAESLRLLTERTDYPVSSHYLIPTLDDDSYPEDTIRVHSLVPELRRAWHAGRSYWAKETGLNDRSIGIELVNEFHCEGVDESVARIQVIDVTCYFEPYSEEQIQVLIRLVKDILGRYPELDPIDIVAHSDIATRRKSDPGPLFPWRRLYESGIGAWPDDETVASYRRRFADGIPSVQRVQQALLDLGYQIEVNGLLDSQTTFAVRGFQLHFRADDHSGLMDVETAARLWALLEKYRPRTLRTHAQNAANNVAGPL